jgi:hypothetical protein
LIGILCSSAPTAENEASRTAGPASAAARSTTAPPERSWSGARSAIEPCDATGWSEALGELSSGRVQLAEIDRLKTIVHEAAIQIGRVVRTSEGDRIGLRVLDGEPRREQGGDFAVVERLRVGGVRVRRALHIQCLKALTAAACRQRRSCRRVWSRRRRALLRLCTTRWRCRPRFESELKINRLITRRRSDDDIPLTVREAGEIG